MRTVDVYPFEARPGAANMAADEVVLERAAAGRAGLRFYGWDRPTLSLGYFQPSADRLGDPLLAALPWVRRATGGAAIVHGTDLTYALALPPDPAWHDGEPWVCRLHRLISGVLAGYGVAARLVVCGEEQRRGPVLCFLDHTPGDIVVGADKVVGSAQRKHRGAVLQHGSILLWRNDAAPQLPGVGDLAGRAVPADAVRDELIDRVRAAFGWELRATDWDEGGRDRIAELVADKYAAVSWNEKR